MDTTYSRIASSLVNMNSATVALSHGIVISGYWLRHVRLREITGYDERILAEMSRYPIPFKTTTLLARLVGLTNNYTNENTRLQDESKNNIEIMRQLTVGDRIALILHIRAMTFGDKLQCTLQCPNCKEDMSLDLSVSALLLQPPTASDPKIEHEICVQKVRLKVRLITGADLELLFIEHKEDTSRVQKLARSCILSTDPALEGRSDGDHDYDDDFLSMLSSKLQELDPQADIMLELTCPSCQYSFKTPFNAEDFIFQEFGALEKHLEYEIHWVAFNYHWSEDVILSLTMRSRKRYVDLINRTLSRDRSIVYDK